MDKTSEGVVISSLKRELGQLQEALSHVHPLPKLAQIQFIADIKKSMGPLDDPHIPLSLQPVLDQLYKACDVYLVSGNEQIIIPICLKAIEQCGQGWSHLSYWASSEQTLCYSIFWSLKEALDKHQKHISMYSNCRNDGAPRIQFFRLPAIESR